MAIYRFRVTFEDYDDVSRDIEIRPTQTFEDLHIAIQEAIGFDASKTASFYLSDANWKKGKEITSRNLQDEEQGKVFLFSKCRLCDMIADPHQKFLYHFDHSSIWSFYVELFKILPKEELVANYPRCVKVVNEAPKQYGNTIGSLPVPDEFEDLDLDEEPEIEEEVLGTEGEELPQGEERASTFIGSADSDASEDGIELEIADEDMVDDESASENDEY